MKKNDLHQKSDFDAIFKMKGEIKVKTGKDIILEYCKNTMANSENVAHLYACEDIVVELDKGKELRDCLDHCPSAFGLEDFEGDCNIKEEGDYCKSCWDRALSLEVEETNKFQAFDEKSEQLAYTIMEEIKSCNDIKGTNVQKVQQIMKIIKKYNLEK